MKRAILLVLACALAIGACDRIVDLTPPPDAHHGDGRLSDGGAIPPDGLPIGDAFTVD